MWRILLVELCGYTAMCVELCGRILLEIESSLSICIASFFVFCMLYEFGFAVIWLRSSLSIGFVWFARCDIFMDSQMELGCCRMQNAEMLSQACIQGQINRHRLAGRQTGRKTMRQS